MEKYFLLIRRKETLRFEVLNKDLLVSARLERKEEDILIQEFTESELREEQLLHNRK